MKLAVMFMSSLVVLGSTISLHADPLPSLYVNGNPVTLVSTPVANGTQYTFVDVSSNVFQTATDTFTATFVTVSGVQYLNVNSVCANANVLSAPLPCSNMAFSLNDASLGKATLVSTLGTASANLNGNIAQVNFGGSIGSGSAQYSYAPAPTPEPSSLGLLGTGLLGVAGVIRRRYSAAIAKSVEI